MWRQAGFPPLELSSQFRGHPPPDWYSSLLGNLVLRSFLGYALPIPVFFQLSVLSEKSRRFQDRFETVGCDVIPDPNCQDRVARRNYSQFLRSSRRRDRSDRKPRTRRGRRMNAKEMSLTYGYIRASTDKQ